MVVANYGFDYVCLLNKCMVVEQQETGIMVIGLCFVHSMVTVDRIAVERSDDRDWSASIRRRKRLAWRTVRALALAYSTPLSAHTNKPPPQRKPHVFVEFSLDVHAGHL